MKIGVLSIMLLFYHSISLASFIGPDQKPLPETEFRKCTPDFCVELVLTSDSELALRNWNTPSKGVYFPTKKDIKKGQMISAFIIFKACTTTERGYCRLSQQLTIYQPDGKVYSKIPESEIWYNKKSPEGESIGLSVDYVKLIVEPNEQVGTYTFNVTVKDYVSDTTAYLSKSINVTE